MSGEWKDYPANKPEKPGPYLVWVTDNDAPHIDHWMGGRGGWRWGISNDLRFCEIPLPPPKKEPVPEYVEATAVVYDNGDAGFIRPIAAESFKKSGCRVFRVRLQVVGEL